MNFKKTARFGGIFLLCAGICIALLGHGNIAAQGVREGMTLCRDVAIPSLFPFMALANFIALSGLCDFLGRGMGRLTQGLFGLPGQAGGIFLLSLLGGYPVGPMMVRSFLDQGRITSGQARRLLCFCVNGGPSFLITAVGTVLLQNTAAGGILYAAMALGSLTLGMVLRFFQKSETQEVSSNTAAALPPLSDALVEGVSKACSSMIAICAWVVLFVCLRAFTARLPLPRPVFLGITGALEITGGVSSLAGNVSLPLLGAALAFGGVCVHCQVADCLRAARMPYLRFFLCRCAHAALTYGYTWALLNLLPFKTQVFSNFSHAVREFTACSTPAAIGLFFTCVLFLLDIDKRKKSC